MLIGLISDTHLPRAGRKLPTACAERLAGCDVIVHAGDIVAKGFLDELYELGPPVTAVRGNRDCEGLQGELPESAIVSAAGRTVCVTHDGGPARGRLNRLRRRFADADAVVFGHSHMPYYARDGGFQIFNPGSPTDKRRAPSHTMGIARVNSGSVCFYHLALD